MTTMNVSLTPELVKIIQRKVETGLYGNASEVVRDAIRQLGVTDELLYEIKLERLKKALEPGIKAALSGDYTEYSLEDLMEELDREAEEKRNAGGDQEL